MKEPVMTTSVKIIIVVGIVIAAVVMIANKRLGSCTPPAIAPPPAAPKAIEPNIAPAPAAIPRLVDLGADKCIPCKMMKPILDELRTQYAGRLDVIFIDVWKNPADANAYNIESIPTQVFFSPAGKELYRHVGFMPKEDILAKWRDLGFVLDAAASK
jgi:thioredoxin 1